MQEVIRRISLAILFVLLVPLLAKADCTGRVTKIIDGDSLEVVCNGLRKEVRLAGIDAPEFNQPYGNEAAHFLSSLVLDTTVDLIEKGQDTYGRVLGVIIVHGRILNREMVRAGYAWHYAKHYREEAKAAKRGLWADPKPIAPWDFRHEGARQSVSTSKNQTQAIAVPETGGPIEQTGELVSFNTKTLKYHCPSCEWAIRCTRNCIQLPAAEAKRRGGVPCRVCGGTCSRR